MFVSEETGIDGNKKVNGRKRHIIIDSLGLPITISVTAANVYDGNEGKNLIKKIQNVSSRLTLIRADDTYKGSFVEDAKAIGYEVEFGPQLRIVKARKYQRFYSTKRALASRESIRLA